MGVCKVNPPYKPNNYIVKFGHSEHPFYMMLCKVMEDDKYRFVELKSGLINNLVFNSVEDAEAWLYSFSDVLVKNEIEPTYVP